jgi:hypothetical protein
MPNAHGGQQGFTGHRRLSSDLNRPDLLGRDLRPVGYTSHQGSLDSQSAVPGRTQYRPVANRSRQYLTFIPG